MKDLEQTVIDYVNIESTTGNEAAITARIVSDLESTGWNIKTQPIDSDPKRYNILATRKPFTDKNTIRLLFNSHTDVVPPYVPAREDEKNIYGRGANETKGQIACLIHAANDLVASNPDLADQLGLLFVVGEEIDHIGMKTVNRITELNPEYIVCGMPTEMKFAVLQKGILKTTLRTTGKAGHSGYPSTGESAIHKLIPVLSDILNHPWPKDDKIGDTTLNIGLINGGQAQNAWASEAMATVFFRVTTSVEDIHNQLNTVIAGRATLEISNSNDPVRLSPALLGLPTTNVAFNTDIAFYHRLHQLNGVYMFGAGCMENAHSPQEFVPKAELHECRKIFKDIAIKLLSQ